MPIYKTTSSSVEEISYGGPCARERDALALEVLVHRMGLLNLGGAEQRAELIGTNPSGWPYSARCSTSRTRSFTASADGQPNTPVSFTMCWLTR